MFDENLEVDVENLLENGAVSFDELFTWKESLTLGKFFVYFFSYFHLFFLLLLFDIFLPFESSTACLF